MLIYQNSTHGLSIQYPDDWIVAETGNVVRFYSHDHSFANQTYSAVNVRVGHETTDMDIDDYVETSVKTDYQSKTFPEFKLLSLTNSTLVGRRAYELIGMYRDVKDGPQKVMEMGTILDHKAFYVQYIADISKYLPTAQKMIDSLKINPQTQYISPYK
jgi:eukaryotic-like serine/threonine-protein kinase